MEGKTWEEALDEYTLIGRKLDYKSMEEANLHISLAREIADVTLKGKGLQPHSYLRDNAQEWLRMTGRDEQLAAMTQVDGLVQDLAEQHIAYKILAKSIGDKILQIWDSAKLHGEDVLQNQEFVELSRVLQSAEVAVGNITTAAARITSAGRIKVESLPPDVLAQILKVNGGDLEHLNHIINGLRSGRKWNTFQELVINGLLSGPKTHAVNTGSNALKTILMPADQFFGGLVSGNTSQMHQAVTAYRAMGKFFTESLQMAGKAWKTGDNILDAGHKIRDDGDARIFKTYSKVKQDLLALRQAKDPNITKLPWWEETQAGLYSFLGIPSRGLLMMDEFFKQLNYRANHYARLHEEALAHYGKGAVEQIQSYVEEGMKNGFDVTGRGLDKQSLRLAQEATWTQALRDDAYFRGGVGQGLTNLVNSFPPLRLALPFIRTPTNLFRDFVAHTPIINLATKRYRDAIKEGGERAARARGATVTGGILWSVAIMAAYNGRLTGGYPKDPILQQAWKAAGIEPYSIRVGDTYIPFQKLDPFASFLGVAADIAEYTRNWDDTSRTNFASGAILAIGQNLMSKSYLTGITDLLNAITDESSDATKMEKFIRQVAAMPIPYSSFMRQMKGHDPVREVRSILDNIMNTIPGISNQLPVKYSWLTGAPAVNNILYGDHKDDVVFNELIRLGDNLSVGAPPRKLKGVELNGEQYSRLCLLQGTIKIGGVTQHQRLERLMKSPSYDIGRKKMADMPGDLDNPRTIMIEKVITHYRQQAQNALLREDVELRSAAEHERKIRRQAQRGNAGEVMKLLTMPK